MIISEKSLPLTYETLLFFFFLKQLFWDHKGNTIQFETPSKIGISVINCAFLSIK